MDMVGNSINNCQTHLILQKQCKKIRFMDGGISKNNVQHNCWSFSFNLKGERRGSHLFLHVNHWNKRCTPYLNGQIQKTTLHKPQYWRFLSLEGELDDNQQDHYVRSEFGNNC